MSSEQPNGNNERLLVQRAQQGGLPAFNAIVEIYQRQAYNLARTMLRDSALAQDATQEAFFSAYRQIGRFRGENLRSWLLTIVANRCRDMLRSPHRRRTASLDEATEAGNPFPEEEAIRSEVGENVRAAVAQLPEDQRLVVSLIDLQGLDYEEAARVASVSLGTVKSRLGRGRDRLRTLLRPFLELSGDLPRPEEGEVT